MSDLLIDTIVKLNATLKKILVELNDLVTVQRDISRAMDRANSMTYIRWEQEGQQ